MVATDFMVEVLSRIYRTDGRCGDMLKSVDRQMNNVGFIP